MIPGLVTCLCLTRNRPEMLRRAVKCFREQTYNPRRLLILDTSDESGNPGLLDGEDYIPPDAESKLRSVGALRNYAIDMMDDTPWSGEWIAHWDDDDWSHPTRIERQMEVAHENKLDIVGFSDILFYDQLADAGYFYHHPDPSRYCLGTSLLYRRAVWEKIKFKDISNGQDEHFANEARAKGYHVRSYSSIRSLHEINPEPLMIAGLHDSNVGSARKGIKQFITQGEGAFQWARVTEQQLEFIRTRMNHG